MRKKRSMAVIEQVKQRDGRCVGCGVMEGLDAHHVDSWGANLTDDPNRMVTLCRMCHTKVHTGDPAMKERIEQHLKRVTQPNWVIQVSPISWGNIL